MRTERWRDLTLITLGSDQLLVVACDSAGAVGPKPLDELQVPGELVGRFTTRVPLMEVLSVGAEPVAVIDTLSVEPDPTGAAIRRGIEQELREAGLDPTLSLNGSEEKNFPTRQTGLGVTVIGLADKRAFRSNLTQAGDQLCLIGYPCVGRDVLVHASSIADISAVRALTTIPGVHDIVPIGSRGILAEANDVLNTWIINWFHELPIPLTQSAGPATCLLVSVDPTTLPLLSIIAKPVTLVATIDEHKSH